jgi:hypothetical protein
LGSHDYLLHFRTHKVYFFELNIKFYIKSSPKTLKLVNFSHGSEKRAKNSEFVPEVKNTKITRVRPIPSVIQKEKCRTWKDLAKIGQTKFSFGQPWIHGRRQSDALFFFVKTCFSPIKSSNSSRKSINFFFLEITKSILHINFVHKEVKNVYEYQ